MTRKNPLSLLTFIFFLILPALACQAVSELGAGSAAPDSDALVEAAVATIEARQPEAAQPSAAPAAEAVTSINFELEQILIDLYKQYNPAVVHIFVVGEFGVNLGSGSGFVYDEAGHIITNNHVVADADNLEVAFADGARQSAAVVGTDVDSDLAVIKVESLPDGVSPIPLGDSNAVEAGEFVIAIGNPFGEAGSMSIGIVSGLGRTLESQRVTEGGGRYSLPQVLQTDAAINPGNSGGPLLDLEGRVIGVNSAILTRTGTNSGVGFSIPVAAVKQIVPTLIAEGEYTYPYIGISMAPPLDLDSIEEFNLPTSGGIYITSVVPGSPADEAGLRGDVGPEGDYITAVDGQPVKDSAELISYLVFQTEVGQTIELTIVRDGEEEIVPVTLSPRP
jgi:2-alkenal reductase